MQASSGESAYAAIAGAPPSLTRNSLDAGSEPRGGCTETVAVAVTVADSAAGPASCGVGTGVGTGVGKGVGTGVGCGVGTGVGSGVGPARTATATKRSQLVRARSQRITEAKLLRQSATYTEAATKKSGTKKQAAENRKRPRDNDETIQDVATVPHKKQAEWGARSHKGTTFCGFD